MMAIQTLRVHAVALHHGFSMRNRRRLLDTTYMEYRSRELLHTAATLGLMFVVLALIRPVFVDVAVWRLITALELQRGWKDCERYDRCVLVLSSASVVYFARMY